jgi:hypothetical protein
MNPEKLNTKKILAEAIMTLEFIISDKDDRCTEVRKVEVEACKTLIGAIKLYEGKPNETL